MDLALSPTVPGLGITQLGELCAYGEELGYRHAWLAEVSGPDPFVLATQIAHRTTRMEVGVAVVPVYTRTPAVLASASISVSQVLGGRRFRLGVGSSSEVIVNQWHGQSFAEPLVRVEETVLAIREILSGGEGFIGSRVRTNRYRPALAPSGPIELWVGALRPRMLKVAGRIGDGVCLNLMPARVVTEQLKEVSADIGVMARLQVMVTDDLASARTLLRNQILGAYLAQPVYNQFLAWMGFPEQAAEIARAFAAKDRAGVAAAIPDSLVDDLALLGSPAQIRDRLDEFGEAGVTVAALSVLNPDRAVVEETLSALAP